jgi:hypothetical protein
MAKICHLFKLFSFKILLYQCLRAINHWQQRAQEPKHRERFLHTQRLGAFMINIAAQKHWINLVLQETSLDAQLPFYTQPTSKPSLMMVFSAARGHGALNARLAWPVYL